MVKHSGKVLNKERLVELQQCMKTHIPSARFIRTAEWYDGSFDVEYSYDGLNKDENKALNELYNKWYEIDNPPEPEKASIFNRMLSWFK